MSMTNQHNQELAQAIILLFISIDYFLLFKVGVLLI